MTRCSWTLLHLCNTYLYSLELCQTRCHLPGIGEWVILSRKILAYRNTQWSGRKSCRSHGKCGHELGYPDLHTVPLPYKRGNTGCQGQKCKMVMDFLYQWFTIWGLEAPQGGWKNASRWLNCRRVISLLFCYVHAKTHQWNTGCFGVGQINTFGFFS